MPTQKTPRRKIIAFLMVTLDGYHQTTDGDLSWHNVDDEFNEFAAAQIDEADTLLFGRKPTRAWPSSGAARWRWRSMPA